MKNFFVFSFFVLTIAASSVSVYGQIIDDSKAKLKTSKVQRKGFLFFRPKTGKSQGAPFSDQPQIVPRTSQKTAFTSRKFNPPRYSERPSTGRVKGVQPRFSVGNPFTGASYNAQPRYSPPSPFDRKSFARNPRYSLPSPIRGSSYRPSPRYSPPSPFRNAKFQPSPRYSPPSPFRGAKFAITPRYSPSSPFRGAKFTVTPRYSPPSPFRGAQYAVNPRYSPPSPFIGARYRVNPRYSEGSPFRQSRFRVNPRYSPPSPWKNARYQVRPRYSIFKHRFDINERLKDQARPYDAWVGDYQGLWKIPIRPIQNLKDDLAKLKMANFEGAYQVKLRDNRYYKKRATALRRFKRLKKKGKKPNFDKGEKDLWEPNRKERSSTRKSHPNAESDEQN